MHDDLRDVENLTDRLRAKLLRAMGPAVAKLSRAARGHPVFRNDRELRACLALAKLVPMLISSAKPAEDTRSSWQRPEWWTPERQELYEEVYDEPFDMHTATTRSMVCTEESVGPEQLEQSPLIEEKP